MSGLLTSMRSYGEVFPSPCLRPLKLTAASSNPQTPYCARSSYDRTGVMMTSYGCTTSVSLGLPVRHFFSVAPGVAGVLADQTTVTPSGYTSLATVMVRTFGIASPPDSTFPPSTGTSTASKSVSGTASTIASPSSTNSSNMRLNTRTIIGICVAVLVVVLIFGLGAWYYLRYRKPNESRLGISSSGGSIEQPPKELGLATHSRDLMQQSKSYTAFPWAPLSVDVNESASQIDQADAAKGIYYGSLPPSKAASQNHDHRSTTVHRGPNGGASSLYGVSDLSQPGCTQPSF